MCCCHHGPSPYLSVESPVFCVTLSLGLFNLVLVRALLWKGCMSSFLKLKCLILDLTGYEILGWNYFSFRILKTLLLFHWAHCAAVEKSEAVSSSDPLRLPLSLVFWNFTMTNDTLSKVCLHVLCQGLVEPFQNWLILYFWGTFLDYFLIIFFHWFSDFYFWISCYSEFNI